MRIRKNQNPNKLLQPGRNCWRISPAQRAGFLRNASNYFEAFVESASQAKHSLMILGWDIDSRLPLLRGSSKKPSSSCLLLDFLNQIASKQNNLHIKILVWDFSIIYAAEREFLQTYKLNWKTHERIQFHLDGTHPLGASHHQKIVVVDDKVAFVGGLDLTTNRWDTPQHFPNDPRRVDPAGKPFDPYHDLQMIVDGEAAKSLGELTRKRWFRATGETLAPPPGSTHDPWPASFPPHLYNLTVGIARTDPMEPHSPVREVEQLYLDAIKKARHCIHIENQFLTSAAVCKALEDRLQEKNGPEIVIILPHRGPGLILHKSMNIVRGHFLNRLTRSDRFKRFRIYYPMIEDHEVFVHAKCMIVDDTFVRIGSSNIANRSMGLDTECDLALEIASDEKEKREAVRTFRNQLLSEFLDADEEQIKTLLEKNGSLIQTIESLPGKKRRLVPLKEELDEWMANILPEISLLDPEEPLLPRPTLQDYLPEKSRSFRKKKSLLMGGLFLLIVIGLALLWRSPLMEAALNPELLAAKAVHYTETPWAPVAVIGIYILAGFLIFPITLLILITALIFDPLTAFAYALAGCLANASATYATALLFGKKAFQPLMGKRLTTISQALGQNGILSTIGVRIVPVAPFSIINFAAGASHIRFRDYLIGTLVGMTPGILAITFLENQLLNLIRSPNPANFSMMLALLVGILAAFKILHVCFTKKMRSNRLE